MYIDTCLLPEVFLTASETRDSVSETAVRHTILISLPSSRFLHFIILCVVLLQYQGSKGVEAGWSAEEPRQIPCSAIHVLRSSAAGVQGDGFRLGQQ